MKTKPHTSKREEPGHGHNQSKAKSKFNSVRSSVLNVWDHSQHSGPQRDWAAISTSLVLPFTAYIIGSGQLHTNNAVSLVIIPWYGTSIYRILTSSIWCQASAFLHDPFNLGVSIATEPAPSLMYSLGLLQCQASGSFHDPFMSPKH